MMKRPFFTFFVITVFQTAYSSDTRKNELTVNNYGEITYERAVLNYLKIGAECNGGIDIFFEKDSKEAVCYYDESLLFLPFVRALVVMKQFEASVVPHVYFAYFRGTVSFSGLSFDADICYRADINNRFRISAGIRAIEANWYRDNARSRMHSFSMHIIEHTVIKASYLF